MLHLTQASTLTPFSYVMCPIQESHWSLNCYSLLLPQLNRSEVPLFFFFKRTFYRYLCLTSSCWSLVFDSFTFCCVVIYMVQNNEGFVVWWPSALTKSCHITPLKKKTKKNRPCRRIYFLNFNWHFTTSVLKQYVLQTLFHPSDVPELLLSLHLQRSFILVTEQTTGLGAGLCILRHWPFS